MKKVRNKPMTLRCSPCGLMISGNFICKSPSFEKTNYKALRGVAAAVLVFSLLLGTAMAVSPTVRVSPMKWVNTTGAIGIAVKAGRGGGTYAHKDIAFEFAAWISKDM